MPDARDLLGPLELFTVKFPGGRIGVEGPATCASTPKAGTLEVLDLEVVRRTDNGSLESVDVGTLDIDGADP